MAVICPRCGQCDWASLFRSPIEPAEDSFRCNVCGKTFRRYDTDAARSNYDSCDEGLQRAIDVVADSMLQEVWTAVFNILDSTSERFMLTSEDAGRLAQACVNAIKTELPECLAK
jgi:transposase-like protein